MNNNASPNDILLVSEVADMLRCSKETVKRYIRDGKLPAMKLSKTGPLKIYRYEVDRMLRNAETNKHKFGKTNRANIT